MTLVTLLVAQFLVLLVLDTRYRRRYNRLVLDTASATAELSTANSQLSMVRMRIGQLDRQLRNYEADLQKIEARLTHNS